jgi:hypothetical protein
LQRSRTKEVRREGYAAAAPLRWRAAGWGRTVATARCAAITRAGGRCKLDATHGSYCYQHAPETARERQRNASRGGKAGGNGRAGVSELTSIKALLQDLTRSVLSGDLETSRAAVANQLINTRLRAIELQRRLREQDELEARLEALEEAHARRGRSWG